MSGPRSLSSLLLCCPLPPYRLSTLFSSPSSRCLLHPVSPSSLMSMRLEKCSVPQGSSRLPHGSPAHAGASLACDQLLRENPELDFSDHPMATVPST